MRSERIRSILLVLILYAILAAQLSEIDDADTLRIISIKRSPRENRASKRRRRGDLEFY